MSDKLDGFWLQIPLKRLATSAPTRRALLTKTLHLLEPSVVTGVIFHGIEHGGLEEFDDVLDLATELQIPAMIGATIGSSLSLSVLEYIGSYGAGPDVAGIVLAPAKNVDAPWHNHVHLLEQVLRGARLIIDQPPSLQTPRGIEIARAFATVSQLRAPADIHPQLGNHATRMQWHRLQAQLYAQGLGRPMVPTIDIHPHLTPETRKTLCLSGTPGLLRTQAHELLEVSQLLHSLANW